MKISLSRVVPSYFQNRNTDHSEIWRKEVEFSKGEYVKIVAPSGSGKTSLIHFLYRMRTTYEGSIRLNDTEIRTAQPEVLSKIRRENVSIVFQDLRLFADQTVKENINIKRRLNPYHPEERIGQMATTLGVGDKLESLAGNCSYGEQQRIAIIRALMQPFDFLLLDEPFSHLDNRNAELAMNLMLEEAAARKAAIIFADLERVDYFPFQRILHL
jgi:ABC-type lipoprotein export system ATPase subunit